MPWSKIVRINSNIHRERSWVIAQSTMRMTVQVPGSAERVMPDPHGVVAEHDYLTVEFHFGELLPPPELGRDLLGASIVIAFDEKDVLTPNALGVLERVFAGPPAEVAE